jgi:hypothetical protein
MARFGGTVLKSARKTKGPRLGLLKHAKEKRKGGHRRGFAGLSTRPVQVYLCVADVYAKRDEIERNEVKRGTSNEIEHSRGNPATSRAVGSYEHRTKPRVRGPNVLRAAGICRMRGVRKRVVWKENELEGLTEGKMSKICSKRDGHSEVTTK